MKILSPKYLKKIRKKMKWYNALAKKWGYYEIHYGIEKGTINGFFIPVYQEKDTFIGRFKDGLRNGYMESLFNDIVEYSIKSHTRNYNLLQRIKRRLF